MDIIKHKLKSKEQQAQFLKSMLNEEKIDDRLLEWCGHLGLENKHSELAENFFSCLLERRQKVSDFFYLSEALLQQYRYEEAEECLLELVYQITEPCPLLFNAYKHLGHIALMNKNYDTADEYYNKAYSIDPNNNSLKMCRSLLSIKQKKYEQAEPLLKSFLKDQDKDSKAWLYLAIVRYNLGDRDMALACLSCCLDIDPSNKKAHYLKKKWDILVPLEEYFKFSA